MREAYLNARLDTLDNQARVYSARLENAPGDEQAMTVSISNSFQDVDFFLLGIDGYYMAHSDPNKVGTSAADDIGINLTRLLLTRDTTAVMDAEQDLMAATYRRSFSEPAAVATGKLSARQSVMDSLTGSVMSMLVSSLLGIGILLGIAAVWWLRPALQLSNFAGDLGNRKFDTVLDPDQFPTELSPIARSLKDLSNKIQVLIKEFEQKIIDRTQVLERRAVQFETAADVGKAITSVRVLSELLDQTCRLINERFGYYHVGIFLLDGRKEFAVLTATNSEGGQKMLEKNHKLKVGEKGIVGYVTETAKPRIALDVGQDAVFFDNPDLPQTRSEMALPLVVSGQILGALDVQSNEPQAFSEDDVITLQILADQIAIAIQNANLFNETNKALETARQVYGEVSREAWRKILRQQPRISYMATTPGVVPIQPAAMETNMSTAFETGDIVFGSDGLSIVLPIKIRGEAVGAIRLKKSEIAEAWTQEETNLAIALTDQLSGALESARLYHESQQRASREVLVSDITARISTGSRKETVIRETVQELGQLLSNTRVSFRLTNPPGDAPEEGALRNVVRLRSNGKQGDQE
jgi:GAF domain-containing protein